MDTRTLLQHGYRYALSLTHEKAEAEDLLQEAWARLLKAGAPPHKGTLYTTIRNLWIDRYRRDNVVQFVPTDDADIHTGTSVDAEGRAVTRDRLGKALEVLRPEEREALFLNAVEGYTAAEIGEMSDRPRNTILSLIHRARQKVLAAFPVETKEVL